MKSTFKTYAENLFNNPAKIVENILRFHGIATDNEHREGCVWYTDANYFAECIVSQYEGLFSLETVCAVISILSPANNWEGNKRDALAMFAAVNNGIPLAVKDKKTGKRSTGLVVSTYGPQAAKAYRTAVGNAGFAYIGKGLKTLAFADNILNPNGLERVTVDRHAVGVALMSTGEDHKKISLTAKRYRIIQDAYIQAAKEVCYLTPMQMQAVTWLAYRNRFSGVAKQVTGKEQAVFGV